MRARIIAAVLLAVTLWCAPTVAEASFNKQAASAQTASSAMLHPPTSLTAKRSACSVTLTWTSTVDNTAAGYRLYNGATLVQTITPATVSTKTVTITKNASNTFTLVTYYLNWTSTASNAASISC
jgi:hypothetical protein